MKYFITFFNILIYIFHSSPTFDNDSDNKVLMNKVHKQKLASKKASKLYFLDNVENKLNDIASWRALSSKSSSSVLFNFDISDLKSKEPLTLNTYSSVIFLKDKNLVCLL